MADPGWQRAMNNVAGRVCLASGVPQTPSVRVNGPYSKGDYRYFWYCCGSQAFDPANHVHPRTQPETSAKPHPSTSAPPIPLNLPIICPPLIQLPRKDSMGELRKSFKEGGFKKAAEDGNYSYGGLLRWAVEKLTLQEILTALETSPRPLNSFLNTQSDPTGLSALHIASAQKRGPTVRWLLQEGANYKLKDKNDKYPIPIEQSLPDFLNSIQYIEFQFFPSLLNFQSFHELTQTQFYHAGDKKVGRIHLFTSNSDDVFRCLLSLEPKSSDQFPTSEIDLSFSISHLDVPQSILLFLVNGEPTQVSSSEEEDPEDLHLPEDHLLSQLRLISENLDLLDFTFSVEKLPSISRKIFEDLSVPHIITCSPTLPVDLPPPPPIGDWIPPENLKIPSDQLIDTDNPARVDPRDLKENHSRRILLRKLEGYSDVVVKEFVHPDPHRRQSEFLHELKIHSTLPHPGIASLLGFTSEEGRYCIVQEYYPYGSLQTYVRESKAKGTLFLDSDLALDFTRSLISTLKFVHRQNIAHRDINPANLLLDNSQRGLILIDFGISRLFNDVDRQFTRDSCGTLNFWAPEVQEGEPNSISADIFSFGMVLYYLYTGSTSLPLDEKRLASASTVNHGDRIVQLIRECIQRDPADRPTIVQICDRFPLLSRDPVFFLAEFIRSRIETSTTQYRWHPAAKHGRTLQQIGRLASVAKECENDLKTFLKPYQIEWFFNALHDGDYGRQRNFSDLHSKDRLTTKQVMYAYRHKRDHLTYVGETSGRFSSRDSMHLNNASYRFDELYADKKDWDIIIICPIDPAKHDYKATINRLEPLFVLLLGSSYQHSPTYGLNDLIGGRVGATRHAQLQAYPVAGPSKSSH